MNYFVFVIVLTLAVGPVAIFARAFFAKSEVSYLQLLAATSLIVSFTGAMTIVRKMIVDQGGESTSAQLGAKLSWFVISWGFIYINTLVVLGFLALKWKQSKTRTRSRGLP